MEASEGVVTDRVMGHPRVVEGSVTDRVMQEMFDDNYYIWG